MTSDHFNHSVETLLERASNAISQEDWPRAADLARRVLAIAPDHAEAHALLAMSEAVESPTTTPRQAGASDDRCAWCAAVLAPSDRSCPRCRRTRQDLESLPHSPASGARLIPAMIWGAVVGVLGLGAVLFAIVVFFRPPAFEATVAVPTGDEWVGAGPVVSADATCPGLGQRVCILALGHPATGDVDIDALAEHFKEEYDLPIALLPPIDLAGLEREAQELVDQSREQLKADAVLAQLKTIYPSIWADHEVTLLAVTPHDIFDARDPDFEYLYSVRATRPGRFVVVSSARMDDRAWGDDPGEVSIQERARKLIAREIGALHFGLTFSDDPTSVMSAVFGSRARIDRVDGRLPVEELATTRAELITGVKTFERQGQARTGIFEVEPGRWEFCGMIEGDRTDRSDGDERPPALRLSLYTEAGVWLTSDSGAGGLGALRCKSFTGPGRFELRGSAVHAIDWSVAVGPVGSIEPDQPLLPQWEADFTDRWTPVSSDGHVIEFSEAGGGWTPWFQPISDSWDICWEAYAVPNPDRAPDQNSYLMVSVLIEDEWDRLGEWRYPDPEPGQFGCIQLPALQPHGRHWVFFNDAADFLGFHYTLNGVELVDETS